MTPERYERILELFHRAGELEASERSAFLADKCGDDRDLRRAVESMLSHAPENGSAKESARPHIGRYRVDELLAEGGQGLVFRATDPDLGRPVVIKSLPPASLLNPDALERLRREARISGKLQHPNLCGVLDIVKDGGREHVVMPFIEGTTLADQIRQAQAAQFGRDDGDMWMSFTAVEPDTSSDTSGKPIETSEPESETVTVEKGDIRRLIRLMEKIAAAVHEAHEAGIIHRDLKPANIMLKPNGEPVVLDFGVALDESVTDRLTQEGSSVGTPAYMSPEQVKGEATKIDRRTDVYALGLILYELMVLRRPYVGATHQALFRKILTGDPSLPRRINRNVPPDLEAVCLKAMDVDPARRYATARALADDLRNVRTLKPTVARPPSHIGRAVRRIRRHPYLASTVAVALLVGGVAIYFVNYQARTSETVNWYDVHTRVLTSLLKGKAPDPHDVNRLSKLLPDETSRMAYLENPTSSKFLDRIGSRLDSMTRADGEPPLVSLRHPRSRITGLTPVFRFDIPADALDHHYVLEIAGDGLTAPKRVRFRMDEKSVTVAGGAHRASLAWTGPPLEANAEYTWRVGFDLEKHPDLKEIGADVTKSRTCRFVATDPDAKRRLLRQVQNVGDPAADKLLRATALLAHGFAHAALVELEHFPIDATERDRRFHTAYRAWAFAILEDRERYEIERAKLGR